MNEKPVIAITQGDPSGIGPEIIFKALLNPAVIRSAIPVVIGHKAVLSNTKSWMGSPLTLREITRPSEAAGDPGLLEFIDPGPAEVMDTMEISVGSASAAGGKAAYHSIALAAELALSGHAGAVVTTPVSKEALHLAGYPFPGHTEILAELTAAKHYAMLLTAKGLHVMHVTTHMAMRDACNAITKERVLHTIRLADLAKSQIGASGAIAVAGFNAHNSENGLFGAEESAAIVPAIDEAKAMGIEVIGPIPADTVFVKALAGQYGMVVAMYHDQGHIPVKMLGFTLGGQTTVSGVNCTIGLPIIRTSVDHGTAYDIAGKGIANEESLLDAIAMAAAMCGYRGPRTLS